MIDGRVVVHQPLQHNLNAGHQTMVYRRDDDRIRVEHRFDFSRARHAGKDRNAVLPVVRNVVADDSSRKVAVDHAEANAVPA